MISRKKRPSSRLGTSFSGPYYIRFLTNSHPKHQWGYFLFSGKIGPKSAKNWVFCILFRPMGGLSYPAPPGFATDLVNATKLQKLTYRPLMGTRGWFQRSGSCSFEFLVESDSVERSDCNVLQVYFVFSFQLFFSSTVIFRLQRWSPRGHILKSLASKPQVFQNCSVLGSRTAIFFESLKFCRSRENFL